CFESRQSAVEDHADGLVADDHGGEHRLGGAGAHACAAWAAALAARHARTERFASRARTARACLSRASTITATSPSESGGIVRAPISELVACCGVGTGVIITTPDAGILTRLDPPRTRISPPPRVGIKYPGAGSGRGNPRWLVPGRRRPLGAGA